MFSVKLILEKKEQQLLCFRKVLEKKQQLHLFSVKLILEKKRTTTIMFFFNLILEKKNNHYVFLQLDVGKNNNCYFHEVHLAETNHRTTYFFHKLDIEETDYRLLDNLYI